MSNLYENENSFSTYSLFSLWLKILVTFCRNYSTNRHLAMNKLVLLFCSCFNQISAVKAIPKESLFDGESLKILDHIDTRLYPELGWLPGRCRLPENDKITLKNLTGQWFLRAFKEFMPVIEGTNPFLNFDVNYDCLKFVLSTEDLDEELIITYDCRTQSTDYYSSECKIFVKFDKTNMIAYPITNCPAKAQVKNVLIADTDYANYLTIVGCQAAKMTNQTIVHQNAYLILSKTVGVIEPRIGNQIKRFFRENGLVNDRIPTLRTLLSNSSQKLMQCSCKKIYCSALKQGCYPGNFVNITRKIVYFNNAKYPRIILFVCVIIFVVFAILLIITCQKLLDIV